MRTAAKMSRTQAMMRLTNDLRAAKFMPGRPFPLQRLPEEAMIASFSRSGMSSGSKLLWAALAGALELALFGFDTAVISGRLMC